MPTERPIRTRCQILNRNVEHDQCFDLQASHEPSDCFGCSCPSRLCAKCRRRSVRYPEIDLCEGCLQTALEAEATTEGEALATPCTGCQLRPVYYTTYQWCLHCSVAFAEEGIVPPAPPPPDRDQTMDSNGSTRKGNRRLRRYDDQLYAEVKTFVMQQDAFGVSSLCAQFPIATDTAKMILSRLAEEGVIEASGKKYRPYIVRRHPEPQEPIDALPTTSLAVQPVRPTLSSVNPTVIDQLETLGLLALRDVLDQVLAQRGQ